VPGDQPVRGGEHRHGEPAHEVDVRPDRVEPAPSDTGDADGATRVDGEAVPPAAPGQHDQPAMAAVATHDGPGRTAGAPRVDPETVLAALDDLQGPDRARR
jgi:hypothetical protein